MSTGAPAPVGASLATLPSSSTSSARKPQLRDPRVANAISHTGYTKSMQARDGVELSFEEWTSSFAGRVEKVEADRLYIVELTEADGEFKLGLIASSGRVFEQRDEDDGEQVPYIKALWFGRCSAHHGWGLNPEFEHYMDGDERMEDALPTESCLLEVEDSDLTEGSVDHKWSKPVANHGDRTHDHSTHSFSLPASLTRPAECFASRSARNSSRHS